MSQLNDSQSKHIKATYTARTMKIHLHEPQIFGLVFHCSRLPRIWAASFIFNKQYINRTFKTLFLFKFECVLTETFATLQLYTLHYIVEKEREPPKHALGCSQFKSTSAMTKLKQHQKETIECSFSKCGCSEYLFIYVSKKKAHAQWMKKWMQKQSHTLFRRWHSMMLQLQLVRRLPTGALEVKLKPPPAHTIQSVLVISGLEE